MRALAPIAIAALAAFALATPAQAITVTVETRSAGAPIDLRAEASRDSALLGTFPSGTAVQVDYCGPTESRVRQWMRRNDVDRRDRRYRNWDDYESFCRVPGQGWIKRDALVGPGLVNVTQPVFLGHR